MANCTISTIDYIKGSIPQEQRELFNETLSAYENAEINPIYKSFKDIKNRKVETPEFLAITYKNKIKEPLVLIKGDTIYIPKRTISKDSAIIEETKKLLEEALEEKYLYMLPYNLRKRIITNPYIFYDSAGETTVQKYDTPEGIAIKTTSLLTKATKHALEFKMSLNRELKETSPRYREELKMRAIEEFKGIPLNFKKVFTTASFNNVYIKDNNTVTVLIPRYHLRSSVDSDFIKGKVYETEEDLLNAVKRIYEGDIDDPLRKHNYRTVADLNNNVYSVFLNNSLHHNSQNLNEIDKGRVPINKIMRAINKEINVDPQILNELQYKTITHKGVRIVAIGDNAELTLAKVESERGALDFAVELAKKSGITTLTFVDSVRLPNYLYGSTFYESEFYGRQAVINVGAILRNKGAFDILGTIVHEIIGHPLIGSIKASNPKLFENLYKEVMSTDLGKEISYNLPKVYFMQGYEKEEIIVRYLQHQYSKPLKDLFENKETKPFLKQFLHKFIELLNRVLKKFFGVGLDIGTPFKDGKLDLSRLSENTSIEDLLQKVVDNSFVVSAASAIRMEVEDTNTENKEILKYLKTLKKTLSPTSDEELYLNSATGKKYFRVGDEEKGGMSYFLRTKGKKSSIEDRADKLWAGNDPEKVMNTNLGPMNKKDYIDKLNTIIKEAQIRGKILHAKLRKASGDWNENLQNELEGYLSELGVEEKLFNWIDDNVSKIFDRLGINTFKEGIEESKKDKLIFEQPVSIEEFNIAGTIDILVKHPDNTFSIIDLKTGFRFNDSYMVDPFKYGDLGSSDDILWATYRNKAKLQKMLYAFALKSKYPNIKFKNIYTLWLPSKHYLKSPQMVQKVRVKPYLEMMKKVFQNEFKEQLELIKDRVGKEEFNKLFNPEEYMAGYSHRVTEDMAKARSNNQRLLDLYLAKLRHAVMYDPNPESPQALKGSKGKMKKAAKITKKILELLEKDNTLSLDVMTWNKDIGDLSLFLGTRGTIPSPYIRIFNSLLTAAEQKVDERFQVHYNKFRSLLQPILDNYYQRKGALHKTTRGLIGKIDKAELFEFARIPVYNDNGEIIDYRFRITEEDWNDAINKYSYINHSNLEIYKNFVDYINNSYAQFFVDEKSKNGTAIANEVATYRFKNRDGSPQAITYLDLHNGVRPSRPHQRKFGIFKYSPGFYPKVFKTLEEYPTMSKEQLIEYKNREFSFHLEHNYELQDSTDEAIPMKYLGSVTLNAQPELYSVDLEHQYVRFMKNYLRLEEMKDVYAIGKGLTYYLKHKDDSNFKKTNEWLEFAVKDFIRGIRMEDQKLIEKSIKRYSPTKIANSFMKAMSIPTLGLNLVGGTANGIFITIQTTLASIRNSILKKNITKGLSEDLLGIRGNEVSFTFKDLKQAWVDVWDMAGDIMKGEAYNNKLFLLLNKFNYLPNNWDWALSSELLKTTGNRLFSSRTIYLFYSLPEEIIASLIMAAQLRSMKIVSGEHKGKSLWEMYEVVEKKDENGNPYKIVEWKKDSEGKPISRGVIKTPEGYKDVTELTSVEIERLHYTYEALHGGYRDRDRMKIEMSIWGRMFFQFKKFLPNILRGGITSSHENPGLGRFVPTGEIKDGKEVVKWVSQVMEGRWKVLAKSMFYYMNMRVKENSKDGGEEQTMLEKVFSYFAIDGNENYSWDELDTSQKEAIIDAMQTLSLWSLLGFFGIMAFGGDSKDPWYKFYYRIVGDITAFYNPFEFSKNLANFTPVSWKKGYDVFDSTSTVFTSLSLIALGDEESAFTQEGFLRGGKSFIRNVPLASGIYRTYRQYADTGEIDDYFPILR